MYIKQIIFLHIFRKKIIHYVNDFILKHLDHFVLKGGLYFLTHFGLSFIISSSHPTKDLMGLPYTNKLFFIGSFFTLHSKQQQQQLS